MVRVSDAVLIDEARALLARSRELRGHRLAALSFLWRAVETIRQTEGSDDAVAPLLADVEALARDFGIEVPTDGGSE